MKRDKSERRKRGKKALKNLMILIVIPLLLIIFLNWKLGLIVFGIVFLYKLFQMKKRGYFAKDNEGKELGFKKFMKRWKLGIEGITPLQQARTNLMGLWIVISGILAGIIINALVRMGKQWIWIEIILGGSLVITVTQMIGGFQKFWRFKEVEKTQKKIEEDLKKEEKIKDFSKNVLNNEEENPAIKEKVKIIKMEKIR